MACHIEGRIWKDDVWDGSNEKLINMEHFYYSSNVVISFINNVEDKMGMAGRKHGKDEKIRSFSWEIYIETIWET